MNRPSPTKLATALTGLLLALCNVTALRADVKPAALFGDHMVLQQGMSVPVWGWADPGEQVTVSIAGQKQSATAGPDRKWIVRLANLRASADPLEMTIAGKNTIRIVDILVGEVWLGSGQSNMDFVVSGDTAKYPGMAQRFAGIANEAEEIAAANCPKIREFRVPLKTSELPLEDVAGKWQVCTPETVPGFSAIGYLFSRDLQKAINQPIGFITSAFGASCAQAWVSQDVLESDARLKPIMDGFAAQVAAFKSAAAATAAADSPAPPATAPPAQAGGARGGRGGGRGNPLTNQHSPYVLWNAMIKPIQPYAIKGVLWYQGESITEGLQLYPVVMEHVIASWRQQWGQGEFPFYFVQLAAEDANSNRPEVREAQAQALKVPNTAMAVAMDIGEKTNVHPKNKQDLCDRLARIARANVYGERIESSGPVYDSMQVEGQSIRVKFTHLGGGLVAKGGDLKWFQIAGADRNFVDAAAKIDGNTIVVTAPGVAAPVAVRYAWHRWPEGANLYNAAGLPAPQFRSDDWASPAPAPDRGPAPAPAPAAGRGPAPAPAPAPDRDPAPAPAAGRGPRE
jgi:sialate O-acetylesterase